MKLLLLLSAVLISVHAQAQQYPVMDVRATGSKRFAEQEIVRASGIAKGTRPVSLDEVKDAAGKLLALGVFTEVSYRHSRVPGGMRVEFMVKDAADFVRADFDNIVWLPPAERLAQLRQRAPLFSGELPLVPDSGLSEQVRDALQALLDEHGVSTAVMVMPLTARDGRTEAYVFHADDVDVKIGEINFAGASAAFLPKLETVARDLLGIQYHRSTLQSFITHNLSKVYQRAGYLRAEFAPPHVAVASHKDTETMVVITMPVSEGRAYSFAGLRWSGNTVLPVEDLDRYLNLRPGLPADGVQLALDLARLRTNYAHRGYMHMHLASKPAYDDAAGTVRFEVALHEGELFSMGKLEVAGLQPSSAERVRQRWRMREGDPYDATYVKSFFEEHFRLPPGVTYVVEQSEGEAKNSIDLTLIFCKQGIKCLASNPNQLYIPDDEPRRRQ